MAANPITAYKHRSVEHQVMAASSQQQNDSGDACSMAESAGGSVLRSEGEPKRVKACAASQTRKADSPLAAKRPVVLITSHTLMGHLSPMLRIASKLVERGWVVAFLGPTAHKARIESSGAKFIPLQGAADLFDKEYYAKPPTPGYAGLHWSWRVCEDIRHQLIEPLPTAWDCFKVALSEVQQDGSESHHGLGNEVILLTEAFSWGVLPMFYGAALPEGVRAPLGSVCISVTVPAIRSADLPPMGYPFPYDPSPAGRALNQRLWAKSWTRRAEPLTTLLDEKLLEAGATRCCTEHERPLLSGANYLVHDAILQLGVPGLDYPRSDWPPHFRFIGLAQGGSLSNNKSLEEVDFPWWDEILANSSRPAGSALRKKVLVVAQGTVEINPHDLIIPTLQAYAGCEDKVLVVAILGWKDATLDDYLRHFPGNSLPGNARVADFLNYDTVLQHADVWIHNAGFGALCHGIANGVPMVCAGEGMDKVDNSRRVAWAGAGVDVGTQTPNADMVRAAVDRILSDEEGPRFKAKIANLQQQSKALGCIDAVESELLKLARDETGPRRGI
ncbi:uncharacterized protein B0I36DRAFT_320735 [Microdochium trichocladiopsis]|uniref:Erythromycin biosynthesis protein CIII-like C-terminal domain-containing protein n=1 Tax=Microdochium trichocladiopsis TaxID=1682393 RepID=A0A9P8Y8S9_9PEZI|nr:uncharacterized protein B0I36DRAFT_320735 [Microdochium trichocladiopsis]KAH7033078.1 hypothetical protein B0I36DRAFT_320735 [Microdochium trichocladiopsis]